MSDLKNPFPPGLLASVLTGNTEWQIVQDQFKRAYEEFQKGAFAEGEPIMCQMHNAFGTVNTTNHNCLGCTFAESILLVRNFLSTHSLQTQISYAYQQLILVMYLLTTRIETLFDIIDLNRQYREEQFRVLVLVRKWANFLKHPKAFLLTHHPTFLFEGCPGEGEARVKASVVIDRQFIEAYYSNDERNDELFRKLENKENVLVIFPNALQLCDQVCNGMRRCIDVVAENRVYRELLAKKTTFLDYFAGLNSPSPPPASS